MGMELWEVRGFEGRLVQAKAGPRQICQQTRRDHQTWSRMPFHHQQTNSYFNFINSPKLPFHSIQQIQTEYLSKHDQPAKAKDFGH